MPSGLVIPLSLDPREWLRGIRRVETTLNDFEDDLEDVEDAGRKLGRRLEDVFDDAARDAERAGDRMERGLRDGVEGTSVRAAGGVLAGEVFDEFIESWGEAVRSGDYGEAIRETFSNLGQIGGVFGPAGAAGGAVAGLFLTGLYDRITADAQREGQINAAIRDLFLGVRDDAAEAGTGSWIAFRDAVVAAARSDEAIAQALGVDSFADALGLIEQVGKELGQTWQNDVLLALTDAGPAGEAAAQRVRAAWEESNATIAALEVKLADARERSLFDQENMILQLIGQEQSRNRELEKGTSWLRDQSRIADGLADDAREQFKRDQMVVEAKRDQAAAARRVADEVRKTPDPSLRNLTRDLGTAADRAERTKRAIETMPTSRTVTVTVRELGNRRVPL